MLRWYSPAGLIFSIKQHHMHLTRTSHMNTSHNHNHKKKSYEYISIAQSCGLTITRKYHNHTKKHLLTIKKSSNKIPHNLVVQGTEANRTSLPGLPRHAMPPGLSAEVAPHLQASRPGPLSMTSKPRRLVFGGASFSAVLPGVEST